MSLRGVAIGWTKDTVRIRFYYDGPISEEDLESAQVAGTEIIAGFPDYLLELETIRVDYPDSLDPLELWAFRRKEP